MTKTTGFDALSHTVWMLMARYQGRPMIPARIVCDDFFAPLTYQKFLDKANNGVIDLPLVKMEDSMRAPRYVAITDLANFLDKRHEEASEEARRLAS